MGSSVFFQDLVGEILHSQTQPGHADLLAVLAGLTLVVGNVVAIVQDDVKRMLAYSSIAHAGYVLIGLVTATADAYAAVLFYLLVYVFMNLGAFAVIIALAHQGRDCDRIDDFAGLSSSRPGLAALMTLFMVALAGIPGTGGFVAKFARRWNAIPDQLSNGR